jgi:hypothetical protein
MFPAITIQNLVNFRHHECHCFEFQTLEDGKSRTKLEKWQAPLASGPWLCVPASTCPRAHGNTAVAQSLPASSRRCCRSRHLPLGLDAQHLQPLTVYTALRLILVLPWCKGETNFFPLPRSSHRALATMLCFSPSASAPSAKNHHWELPLPPLALTCRHQLGVSSGQAGHRTGLTAVSRLRPRSEAISFPPKLRGLIE